MDKPVFTPEHIAALESAHTKCVGRLDYDSNDSVDINGLIAELQKKPTFEVGQVIWNGDDRRYQKHHTILPPALGGMRPLTPQECGPHVVKMLDALKRIHEGNMPIIGSGWHKQPNEVAEQALSTLPEGWK